MDDGNGSFCVNAYKKSSDQVRMEIKANETVEHKLHTEQVGRENSCGTHENEL